jgi:hypothetical protein
VPSSPDKTINLGLMRQLPSSEPQLLLILLLLLLLSMLLSMLLLLLQLMPPLLFLLPLLLGARGGKATALGVAKLPHQQKHIASNYSEKLHRHPQRFQLPSFSPKSFATADYCTKEG